MRLEGLVSVIVLVTSSWASAIVFAWVLTTGKASVAVCRLDLPGVAPP